jgi:YidC/Oxa1 family membrane protein insertase
MHLMLAVGLKATWFAPARRAFRRWPISSRAPPGFLLGEFAPAPLGLGRPPAASSAWQGPGGAHTVGFAAGCFCSQAKRQSYRSMIKMQRLQPQVAALREGMPEKDQADKEIVELYKRENVTAPSGCLPIFIQALLFFSFYKMLFVTIEAHAPFFGWVHDLVAPDPANVFNLFGLIPFEPTSLPVIGSFLHIGAWPIILGLTIWQLQRKISPVLLGSFQRNVYDFLPILVAYFSANRMAAIVICLAFYNVLSIIHQLILMKTMKGAVGNINKYSAEVLPYGKIQPIVFLMMLAPVLQNFFFVLIFWRRSKTPTISK